ncbi:MAG: hypothetical protein A2664_00250 [Candidatus Taylorbacteria bacterium RIFCSPHIGHO2_01_FULL_46_22b]|uniref:EamA domain-containing protein n=1 Tax=Candidatus Taylorbacteria bacterium RIFCSPHIGHO2_01_FULL_46_22b TaxID=1802301 RepID=A0A1G2M418_9BACT|nr:MAG: hypothetical protein A2664_00250 [Candidatus Taylorbacteria bacterium RIFCSPHIGHO2_01_FULL_46_22b]
MKAMYTYALLTGLFWGCYGPALAIARGQLKSPWAPYLAIGIAYLVWAVVCGWIGMKARGETISISNPGFWWAFGAGTLGAFGALSLTLAMVSGGSQMPQVIMAMVFGSAVLVAAVVAFIQLHNEHHVPLGLWIGIVAVAGGVILISYNTPVKHPVRTAAPTVRL